MNIPGYSKKVKGKYKVYQLTWSNYIEGKKFEVLKKFTEMTGIYVVFYVNKFKRLTPCIVGGAWFTGLRPTLLKLFNRLQCDTLPEHIFNKLQNEKVYIKSMEVYELSDFSDILFSIKNKYPQAFFDSNGVPEPEDCDCVKTIDINTKIYYKQKKDIDL